MCSPCALILMSSLSWVQLHRWSIHSWICTKRALSDLAGSLHIHLQIYGRLPGKQNQQNSIASISFFAAYCIIIYFTIAAFLQTALTKKRKKDDNNNMYVKNNIRPNNNTQNREFMAREWQQHPTHRTGSSDSNIQHTEGCNNHGNISACVCDSAPLISICCYIAHQ